MTRLTCSMALAVLTAAHLVPARGSAQGLDPRKSAPPISPEQVTATLKGTVDARLATFAAQKQKAQEQSAQRIRAQATALTSRLREAARIRVDTTLPVIDTVLTAEGGADPRSIFVLLGSKLTSPGQMPGVRVTFQGQDLQATYLPGGSTPDRLEAYLPAFGGIAGPTPALVTVQTYRGKSVARAMMVKPELEQKEANLYEFYQSILKAEPHGGKLKWESECLRPTSGPHCWNFYTTKWLGVYHGVPSGEPADSGTDSFLSGVKLKNNWVLKELVWRNPMAIATPGLTNATPTVSLGTDALTTTVRWSFDAKTDNRAMYYFGYLIEGPLGMPYK